MKKKVLEKKSFIPEKDWSETKMILEDEGQEDQGNLALGNTDVGKLGSKPELPSLPPGFLSYPVLDPPPIP